MAASQPAEASKLSWMHFQPDDYDALLAAKVEKVREEFAAHLTEATPIEVNASAPRNFRERARFCVARFPPDDALRFALFEGGAPSVAVDEFPIASLHINTLMPLLIAELNASAALGGTQIAAVHFLGTSTGDMLVSLIYEGAPMPIGWDDAATALRDRLNAACCRGDGADEAMDAATMDAATRMRQISILGRCKGTCTCIGSNHVEEVIPLADGRRLTYRQVEGSFSNPSARMCAATLNFLSACATAAADDVATHDATPPATPPTLPNLLELYCGNGNHTVALGKFFRRVLAVEIDKKLCEAAELNLAANGVANTSVLCASSGKFCDRLLRKIRRARAAPAATTAAEAPALAPPAAAPEAAKPAAAAESAEDLWMREAVCRQDVILVDPPRCGLDAVTRSLVAMYEHVFYISCNPTALLADLQAIGSEYAVERLAVFDHFAYSHHLEVGVHLRRRRVAPVT